MKIKSAICMVLFTGLLLPLLLTCKKNADKRVPMVVSIGVVEISDNTARTGGFIIGYVDDVGVVIACGVCWSTNPNPTISDTKTTDINIVVWSSYMYGLTPGTTYYLRAYATNSAGTGYSTQYIFTKSAFGKVLTTEITSVTSTTAIGGGNITDDKGSPILIRGVCWNTTQNPTIEIYKTTDGIGSGIFTSNITGLMANTTYYLRAYATNSVGTAYGSEVSFKTKE